MALAEAVPEEAAQAVTGNRNAQTLFMEAEKQITEFVERLKQAVGANLECVVLFGSAVSGDFHPDFSDVNILCLVRELPPQPWPPWRRQSTGGRKVNSLLRSYSRGRN